MANYKSYYTGSQIDAAIAQSIPGGPLDRALPGGELDNLIQSRAGKQLLVNAWLSAPYLVNQRGQSSYSTDGYCIDGWTLFLNSGVTTLTVNPEYITINPVSVGSGINQFLEQTLPSGTYTISIKQSDGTIISKTYEISGTTVTSISGNNPSWGGISLGYYNGMFYFQIIVAAGYSCSISAAKLEPGSISTLAYDTPPTQLEQELNRQTCMRYYLPLGDGIFSTKMPGYTFGAVVHPPVKMRTTPTVLYGTLTSYSPAFSGQACTFLGIEVLGGGTELLLQVSQLSADSDYTVGRIDGFTGLSAEL